MSFLAIVATAIGLAMDALAVSAANGVALRSVTMKHALTFGLYFGLFQFFMPILGWLLGSSFAELIVSVDHWIAFALLAGIGVKMLWETFSCPPERETPPPVLSWKAMSLMALATSIDALAVGISFAMINVNIWLSSVVIGLVAFALSFAGVLLGKRLGCKFGTKIERLGGCVLIFIGGKILLEHLYVI